MSQAQRTSILPFPLPRLRGLVALAFFLFASLWSLACGKEAAKDAGAAASTPAKELPRLRFSGIPDADKDKLTELYKVVATYLSAELGRPVEYVHVPDYTAAVTALAANKLDFVWLGGVTAVQAEERTKGKVEFVAAREMDMRFKSYFIANADVLESGSLQAAPATEPMPLAALGAMKTAFAGRSFSFGSKSSTSGHIMPRHFMRSPEVQVDPESSFRSPAGYQLKGGHSATLRAVASGAVDLGVVNYTVWDRADEATKAQAPVIYVTPEYVDYVMVAHERMGQAEIDKLREALLALDPNSPRHGPVLEAFGAKRFVGAKAEDWAGIRSVLEGLRSKGMLN
jgi:phosphonate transport system substrate-binding protein